MSSGGSVLSTVFSRAHVTFDGGKTWTTYPVRFNGYKGTGDPSIAFDQDGTAYDYGGAFNFGQAPLKPVVMVTTGIPRWERTWLAAHPDKENDPT